jgi:hypothetical protein
MVKTKKERMSLEKFVRTVGIGTADFAVEEDKDEKREKENKGKMKEAKRKERRYIPKLIIIHDRKNIHLLM